MHEFWMSFAGGLASGITALILFWISWYVKKITKRKSYLYKRMDEFNDEIINISKRATLNKIDTQMPRYIWRTKVLGSELIILKNDDNGAIDIKKMKHIFLLDKENRIKLLHTIRCIDLIVQVLGGEVDSSIGRKNKLLFLITWLISEFFSNLNKVTLTKSIRNKIYIQELSKEFSILKDYLK